MGFEVGETADQALYAIEAEIRGQTADARHAVRQARARPAIKALEPWLRAKLETIRQKTQLAEAIRYALSRWADLTLFLNDGRVARLNGIDREAYLNYGDGAFYCHPPSISRAGVIRIFCQSEPRANPSCRAPFAVSSPPGAPHPSLARDVRFQRR